MIKRYKKASGYFMVFIIGIILGILIGRVLTSYQDRKIIDKVIGDKLTQQIIDKIAILRIQNERAEKILESEMADSPKSTQGK